MTTPSEKPKTGSFSSFGIGIVLGVAATFLFGTEEGRKLVKKLVDSLPDSSLRGGTPTWPDGPRRGKSHSIPIIQTEETQHHATFEAPPPPEPKVRPTRPEPFTPRG